MTINSTLDYIAAAEPVDFLIMTGDLPPHDIWEQSVEFNLLSARSVLNPMRDRLKNMRVFPVIGPLVNVKCDPSRKSRVVSCGSICAVEHELPLQYRHSRNGVRAHPADGGLVVGLASGRLSQHNPPGGVLHDSSASRPPNCVHQHTDRRHFELLCRLHTPVSDHSFRRWAITQTLATNLSGSTPRSPPLMLRVRECFCWATSSVRNSSSLLTT